MTKEKRVEKIEAVLEIPEKYLTLPELFEKLRAGEEINWDRVHPKIKELLMEKR